MKYYTEEGHVMDYEDYIQYVKFKVLELIKHGYSKNEIINFDDYYYWKHYSVFFMI
jgi:hypothetical protein